MPVRRWTNLTMGTRAWVMGVTRAQWVIVLQTEAVGQLPYLFFLNIKIESDQTKSSAADPDHYMLVVKS
jgi:hypothetical protein